MLDAAGRQSRIAENQNIMLSPRRQMPGPGISTRRPWHEDIKITCCIYLFHKLQLTLIQQLWDSHYSLGLEKKRNLAFLAANLVFAPNSRI